MKSLFIILSIFAGAIAVFILFVKVFGFPPPPVPAQLSSDDARVQAQQTRNDQENKEWLAKYAALAKAAETKAAASEVTAAEREQYSGTITITANELHRAYEANEIAADEKYKGKSVRVTGRIQAIGKDILGSPFVVIGGTGMLDGVQCMFARSEMSSLAALSKGGFVTISGTVSGKFVQVLVRDCTIYTSY